MSPYDKVNKSAPYTFHTIHLYKFCINKITLYFNLTMCFLDENKNTIFSFDGQEDCLLNYTLSF